MQRVNLHLYPSTLQYATRMLKITHSLVRAEVFDNVQLVGLWEPGLSRTEALDERRTVWRVPTCRSHAGRGSGLARLCQLVEWTARICWRYRDASLACVNPHTVTGLPAAVLLKRMTGAAVVYDTHELETESVALGPVRQRFMKLLERQLLPACEAVSVVSEGIADWYQRTYGLDCVWTVHNYPYRSARAVERSDRLRRFCGLSRRDEELVFLYLGLLSPGRGIPLLLDVFEALPDTRHLVLMGAGPLEGMIGERARRRSNIHLHPPVPPAEVVHYASGADVGLALIEDVCLSYRHSLPNKLFEYLNAGIPVVVSDLPDMGSLVDTHACGWRVPSQLETVSSLLRGLDQQALARKRVGAQRWAQHHGWELEEQTLLAMYHAILSPTEPGLSNAARSNQRLPA